MCFTYMVQMQADATSMRRCAHLLCVSQPRTGVPCQHTNRSCFRSTRSDCVSLFRSWRTNRFSRSRRKSVKLLSAWDDLAATISAVPHFAHAEGVTGRGCGVKYEEMMAAHPQEVKNGKFTRGVREGVDDATHEALNTCIQQEDEVEENAANRRAK